MALRRALLQALGYPQADTFNIDDGAQLRHLVSWLENTKIRHYAEAARRGLNDTAKPEWPSHFRQYLADLECPYDLGPSTAGAAGAGAAGPGSAELPSVLQWLLSQAVGLEYEDKADEYNRQAAAAEAAAAAGGRGRGAGGGRGKGGSGGGRSGDRVAEGAGPSGAFDDLSSPEAQGALSELLRLLHVDQGGGGGLAQQLEAAAAALRDGVLPCINDAAARAALSGGGLQQLPLGFETGDAAVDSAARLLRLLYIKDLRQLQSAVDEAIVSVQELTANPKTDSALGKVGH